MPPAFANPFSAVAASFAAAADQLAGLTIEYRRAGSATVTLRALKARYQTDQTTPEPYLAVAHRLVAWLIDPTQTPTPPEPLPGDLIVEDPAGAARQFRVYAPGPAAPVWTWGGPNETWRRVITERVT